MRRKPRICLLVSNDLTRDPRVTKQAQTTAAAGFKTLVACWAYGEFSPPLVENKEGYLIKRGLFNPFWTPKLFFLNLGLAKYNLLLVKKYLVIKIKKIFIILVKIIWFILYLIGKIFHKDLEPDFVRRNLSFLKIRRPVTETTTQKLPEKPAQTEKSLPLKKESLLRKTVLRLNIYRYYQHYYRSMYDFMIGEGVNFRPDIVHANDLDTLWAGWQIKKRTGARLIYDAHEIWTEQGLAYPKLINWLFKVMEKYLFGKIDHFVTVNESLAKVLDATYHFPKNLKQTIIYNCPRYQKSNFILHNTKKTIALYQGRYSPNRGLEQIAKAAKYLDSGIEIHFRGLGDEKLLAELRKIAQEIGRENVKFHPPVEMKDLVQFAVTADIGLIAYLPVHIDNELCLPNKVFEYMMAGLALAVSDLPELRRLVKEYNLGATFNPYSPKDIARKINQLASNNLAKLRQNSLKAAKICSWETEEKKLVGIYKGLL